MARTPSEHKAQAAWERIQSLGGHGVWDSEVCIVVLANTGVVDDDLSLFNELPYVEILDLSHTAISDGGLSKLGRLPALEELVLVGTKINKQAIASFRADHPSVRVRTRPPPKGSVNPFTGEPIRSHESF
jgi:hypothetical protein